MNEGVAANYASDHLLEWRQHRSFYQAFKCVSEQT